MEAASGKGRKGRPPLISNEEREQLLVAKGVGCERWALDRRFMEVTLTALKDGNYPTILPADKRPRTSLLVELGRWGDERSIKSVARNLEEAASENKGMTIKEAISISRRARLELKGKGDERSIKSVARNLEEAASENKGMTVGEFFRANTSSSDVVEAEEANPEAKVTRDEWEQLSKEEQWERIQSIDHNKINGDTNTQNAFLDALIKAQTRVLLNKMSGQGVFR